MGLRCRVPEGGCSSRIFIPGVLVRDSPFSLGTLFQLTVTTLPSSGPLFMHTDSRGEQVHARERQAVGRNLYIQPGGVNEKHTEGM